MGVTCKPYGKDKSMMVKLDNQLKKEQEANKAKKPVKRSKKDIED